MKQGPFVSPMPYAQSLCAAAPVLSLLFILAACAGGGADPPIQAHLQPIDLPAGQHTAQPNLVPDGQGGLTVTWVDSAREDTSALWYGRWDGTDWTRFGVLATGSDWFVNWADFPTSASWPDGDLAAHYLQKTASDTYAYGVQLVRKSADGAYYGPVVAHDDNTPTEHGFVSLVARPDGDLLAVWLDGRQYEQDQAEMTLRAALFDRELNRRQEAVLDTRTCDCCQTAAIPLEDGALVVYRDRSPDEIRDIYAVRMKGDAWQTPFPVARDGWQIAGCPVQGPALAAMGPGAGAAIAWYTAADDAPRIRAAFSTPDADGFGDAIEVADAGALGRVEVVPVDRDRALVAWLANEKDGAALVARTVHRDGAVGPLTRLTDAVPDRSGGFPQMAAVDGWFFLAWTAVEGDETRVRMARFQLPG